MQFKKFFTVLSLVGVFTIASCSEVLASGLGVVDFRYLEQHHPSFSNALTTYQNDIKQYREDFTNKSKDLNDQQKKDMVTSYNNQLNTERVKLFGPIDKDIINSVNKVKADKGLDFVAVKGYVISGDSVDITNDVAQQLGEK